MSKLELFEKELTDLAKLFKVMGHPARIAILKFLAESKVCMTGDITKEIPLGRTTVNQHLKELKELGLIVGDIDGIKTNYCINTDKMKQIRDSLDSFLGSIACCDDSCC